MYQLRYNIHFLGHKVPVEESRMLGVRFKEKNCKFNNTLYHMWYARV